LISFFYLLYFTTIASGIIPLLVAVLVARINKFQFEKQTRFLILLSSFRLITEFAIIALAITIKNSFPAVHVSILLSFLAIIHILNSIYSIKLMHLLYIIGSIAFILDLVLTSDLFKPAFVSSMLTFSIIVGLCIWILHQNEISDEDEKLIGTLLVFYLITLGYYLFMQLLIYKSKSGNIATHLFFIFNLLFNFRISYLIWLKRKN
jgi:hypothetical protein